MGLCDLHDIRNHGVVGSDPFRNLSDEDLVALAPELLSLLVRATRSGWRKTSRLCAPSPNAYRIALRCSSISG